MRDPSSWCASPPPAEIDVENLNLKHIFLDPGRVGEDLPWFYILKEAEIVGRGHELGPVGGRIVAEILLACCNATSAHFQPT